MWEIVIFLHFQNDELSPMRFLGLDEMLGCLLFRIGETPTKNAK